MTKKRSRKFRGSSTYGHGIKGRRGAGRRGGRGMAGLCKHRYTWMVKYAPDHWGRYGFTSHHPKEEITTINVGFLDENIEKYVEQGIAKFDGEKYEIDLSELGVSKLLSKGRVTKRIVVKVKYASTNAVSKIEEAGGEVLHG